MKRYHILLLLVALVFLVGCNATQTNPWPTEDQAQKEETTQHTEATTENQNVAHAAEESTSSEEHTHDATQEGQDVDYIPDITFTLETTLSEQGLGFKGVGGDIDGQFNPTLVVPKGAVVQIILVNGDGMEHDISIPDFNAHSEHVTQKGATSTIVFKADKVGEFFYFCSIPGHREAGMEGVIRVVEEGAETSAESEPAVGEDIVRDPTDLPPPVGDREPQVIRVDLETKEVVGQLADGTTYTYWTFNGKVPGPMIRVRVGDTIELHLKNDPNSKMTHSIDLHAVTGPGGGAVYTQTPPGEENVFTFKALNPGLYVYHCATPMVAHHIANGMYGLILVEPEGGLPPVDREFYVMQGEIYTQGKTGETGYQEFSVEKLLAEEPEYLVFNGAAGGLTTEAHAMKANTGETVRIFFGVGGPNMTSSFHVIGEIFDRVYNQASLTSPALTDVQTTLVPPGGATMVEFKLEVPGRYILVDHALSRLEKGLVGFLFAEGPDAPDIFKEGPAN